MTVAEYNQCVDEYSDGVYRFILKNLSDTERARDVVQEAFTKLWEKRGQVNHEKSKTYLFTTAYHTMIDMIRKEKHKTDFEEHHHQNISVENEFSDLGEILNEALGKLNEIQRHVVLLRDYEGYNYKEIGEITGLNESQVKVYIYRARMFLKQYIVSMDQVV